MLSSLACSEQPAITESSNESVAPTRRLHPYRMDNFRSGNTASTRFYKSSALVSLGTATSSGGRVLLLADEDGASTTALANSIAEAGYLVTMRPAPEYTWDGTNPSLEGYNLIIHLNGNTFGDGQTLSAGAQSALVDFVRAGGGFVGAQWNSYEATGAQGIMQDLVLAGFPGPVEENCPSCAITYSVVSGQEAHPLVAGLPSEFTFEADGHLGGPQVEFATEPSTVVMRLPSGTPGVLARNLGAGKVVNFSFAPNYSLAGDGHTLQDANIRQLYVNAVQWVLDGSTQTPSKAPATITLSDLSATYDGAAKAVSITTNPAGLSGVTVTYSQNGFPVATPVNAGDYDVVATLDHQDYEAPQATGTLTIGRATPVIQWSPAAINYGTPLGPTQLNASAVGVNGEPLAGEFYYLPVEGTILSAGNQPISVEFLPLDVNYGNVVATVTITVTAPTPRLKFKGFFRPVHNLPFVNTVAAGKAISVKFTVEGGRGLPVLQSGYPTSVPVACSAASRSRKVESTSLKASSQLLKRGDDYTYVWKTDRDWAGSCRKLVVTLVDGSKHEAHFRFGKKQNRHSHKPGRDDDD